jgi:hypothetical protein
MTDDVRHPKITQNFLQKAVANGTVPSFCKIQNRNNRIGIFSTKIASRILQWTDL